MSSTLIFTPKAELTAQKNLKEFIRLCRDELTAFNPNLKWEDLKWTTDIKGCNTYFTKLGTHGKKVRPGVDDLNAQYIDFAKAYFRYHFADKPMQGKAGRLMVAIKLLEKAFITLDVDADITKITETVLDEAEEIARVHYKTTAAFNAGRELEALAKFVSEKGISKNYLDWSHSLPAPKANNKTGIEGRRNREKKMPGDDELAALAEIFTSNPENPRHKFATSLSAMMLCQPSRIGEMLRLPFNCDDIPSEYLTYTDSEGKKNTGYGWRFRGLKGYDPEIKWIPKSMTSLGQEALTRIRDATQPARDFALLMEEVISSNNPKFPRHSYCPNVPDDQPLTHAEMACALGYTGDSAQYRDRFLKSVLNKKPKDCNYTLKTLLPFLVDRIPKDFPWIDKEIGLKWSNALFVYFQHELNAANLINVTVLMKPQKNTLNYCLEEAPKNPRLKTIFEELCYNTNRDKPLSLTSKAFRHYLNTIANKGNLSQEGIAKWSARADIGQNPTYNHESNEDRVNIMLNLGGLLGADLDFEIRAPVTDGEFSLMERAPARISEFGSCEHNYALAPCLKFRDCSMCEEEVCIKGDLESLDRLKDLKNKYQMVVERDELHIQQGELNSNDQSYRYNLMKLERLQQKIEILESDDVPDGAQIRLKNPMEITSLERAVASRVRNGLESKGNRIQEKMIDSVNEKNKNIQGLESGVHIVKLIGDFKLG